MVRNTSPGIRTRAITPQTNPSSRAPTMVLLPLPVARAADRVRSAALDEPTGPLGGRFLAKFGGQLADLGFWVAAVAAQGLQEG